MLTLYFHRHNDRPVLTARVAPKLHPLTIAAEYGVGEWIATDAGIALGLTQRDFSGVEGPGLLAEGCPAVSFVLTGV